jgi:hypothetical protein
VFQIRYRRYSSIARHRVSRWHTRLLGIEVRSMLSDAMLQLDICQRESVDEPPDVVRVGEQTLDSCS